MIKYLYLYYLVSFSSTKCSKENFIPKCIQKGENLMRTYILKRIAATTLCATLCLSVVSCHDRAVSFDTESVDKERAHITMKEQEVTIDISNITEPVMDGPHGESETTEASAITEVIAESTPDETISNGDGIEDIIDRNLDILIGNSENFTSEKDAIAAHSEAFDEIVSLGETALPYLQKLAEEIKDYDDSAENLQRIMAKYTAYVIDPQSWQQDIIIPSPDGKYAIKATIDSFLPTIDPYCNSEYNLTVVDANNIIIFAFEGSYDIWDDAYELSIAWAPNSRYVFKTSSYRHYYTTLSVFSMDDNAYFNLPGETQIEERLGENLVLYDPELGTELSYYHLAIDEWCDEDTVRVSITLSNNSGQYAEAGYYQYNLVDQQIMDIHIYK